jgi:hypothetical protein
MIADRVVVDAIADGDDDSRAFVAQDQRQRIGDGAVGRLQVTVANAAGGDAHRHLAMLRCCDFDLFNQNRLADFARQNCLRQLSH